jgi:hypothetical protein
LDNVFDVLKKISAVVRQSVWLFGTLDET